MFSICAAVLAALQTYLAFSERSVKHKEAGAAYAAVWRSLDLLHLELSSGGEEFRSKAIESLKAIVSTLDKAGRESPTVEDADYQKAKSELKAALAAGESEP